MFIGERIRELRLENNLLQKELAANIRIASNTLSQFESGKANPSYDVLISIADFFGCTTDYLLGREDDFGIVHTTTPTAELTTEEKNLLDAFRKLNTKNRMHVVAYAEVRLEEQQHETRRA